ncbi:MAG TPA: thrombospondin type 3 repeat-containing protein [Verrucomicrobiales bacterium]|nr:thrombospondin type 3 repeat-containing protein [Verrucomicrobiales bacterium]
MKPLCALKPLSLFLLAIPCAELSAQTTLIDFNSSWDYMQPMGVFPDSPGGGFDADFDTTWYLKATDFAAQYDGPAIGGVQTSGDPNTPNSYDHGSGPGPLGFDVMDYWNTAGALFTFNGTVLSTPLSGSRYSAYFRKTFTIPNDGNVYAQPIIQYLMDDGGFVYLDGVLILSVNMAAGAVDTYNQFAANATANENQLRVADLGLPAGSATGAGLSGAAANASVVQPVLSLAPGEHTLAVSLHQVNATGTDFGFAMRLTAGPVTPGITDIKVSNARRNFNGTPGDTTDDTVDFSITVNGYGSPGGWIVSAPAGSSLIGQTGSYRAARSFTGVPLAEFSPDGLNLTVRDAVDTNISGSVKVTAPLPVVDWSHSWDYMQPMGVFPDSPGGGFDADFDTTWYLKAADFAAQYDGPAFGGAITSGDPNTPNSYDHGTGPGPLGFDVMDYWNTAGALFSFNGTVLSTPLSGSRYSGYFRTTFTVPNDGRFYGRPVLNYIADDGAFVYLDGVRVLNINMAAGVADTYNQFAANSTDNENQIRAASLGLPAGSSTGAGLSGAVANASVVQPVLSLAPGEHTLAVSLHQVNATGTDFGLSLQLSLEPVTPGISEVRLNSVRRNLNGTPGVLTDDTVDFTVTVTGVGSPAGWVVAGPAGSSLIGQTGAYGVARSFTSVPISQFPGGAMLLGVKDAADAALTGTLSVVVPFPLIEWTQAWDYMQPMGIMPDRPAGGFDADFDTTWYLKAADFAAQYDGPAFGGIQTAGDPNTPNSYDHGTGPAPFGFDVMDYWNTAGALFTGNGTFLTTPLSGSRYSGYYRTTFTVPSDGNVYGQPVISYIMDDGGFVYLDGVLVLSVNMAAGFTDTYMQFAANATDNENQIRVANLGLPAGSSTGTGLSGAGANASVVQQVLTLAPGEHTLAISLHQANATGSDAGLAILLTAVQSTGSSGGDTDGDGVSDADETIMGTDPANPSDVLSLTINASQPNQVTFGSKAGKFYRVFSSPDLNSWSDAGLATLAGDGTLKQFTITTTGRSRRFYRLKVMGTDGPW